MQPMVTMALRAARSAGEIIFRSFEQVDRINVEEKGAHDFVTEVDRASERAILAALKKTYPTHGFLAEESGLEPGKGEGADWLWVIDPLDGTTNFIHGLPHFAISIAVKHKGVVEHGVIFDPMRQEEFTASRGRGASVNGRRMRVTPKRTLDGALIGTGFPFRPEQRTYFPNYMNMFADIAEPTAGIRRAGAAALDLAYVAAGRMDGFWEFGLSEWDMAAGTLMVLEAGGLVSDAIGGHDYLRTGNVVCGNPKLLKQLLQTIQPHLHESQRNG